MHLSFESLGTQWLVDADAGRVEERDLEHRIHDRLQAFDDTYSRFRDDTWLAGLAHGKPRRIALPADAQPLFDLYQAMYTVSDGAVTPLIGQLMSDAGYAAGYRLRPGRLRTPPAWEDVFVYEPEQGRIDLKQPGLFDVGAAGKGYAVDLVCALLEDSGVTQYCVDAGGDMRISNRPSGQAIRVALEHPDDPAKAVGVAELATGSLCGSAGNRRQWAGLHHIMHPHTLEPVRHIKAVWVTAKDALVADGMATCLFFVDHEKLRHHFDFEYIIMYADNTYFRSVHFPGELFGG